MKIYYVIFSILLVPPSLSLSYLQTFSSAQCTNTLSMLSVLKLNAATHVHSREQVQLGSCRFQFGGFK
jgi:hypothetical protein